MTAALDPVSTTNVFLPPDVFVGWLLPDAITADRAAALVAELAARGFARTSARYPANYRDNDRLVFDDPALADALFAALRDRLPPHLDEAGLPATPADARWELVGLNVRFRACRYTDGQAFCIHRDGPYTPADDVRSFLTVQLYLDDDPARSGGRTRFYAGACGTTAWAAIAPRTGAAIVFDHRAWHDGEPVTAGTKHVLRTDAVYRRCRPRIVPSSPDLVGMHRGYAWQAIALGSGDVASTGRDGSVRRWRTSGATCLELGAGSITCLAEDARGALWCGSRAGELYRIVGDPPRATRVASGLAAITGAARSGDRIAVTTSAGEVVVVDGDVLATYSVHAGWAWGLAARGDGWLSCGHDGRIVRVRDGVREWAELGVPLRAIAATASRTVAGDERGWVHWLGRDGDVVRSVRAHTAAITSLAIHQDRVVSASEDGTVKAWSGDGDGDVLLATDDFVTSVAFAADGRVISAGYDGAVRRLTTSGSPTA